MKEILEAIKETKTGLEVKDLRWLPVDNIIVGMCKCPIFGKETLREGFVCIQWNKQGKPLRINKGRTELELNINYESH